ARRGGGGRFAFVGVVSGRILLAVVVVVVFVVAVVFVAVVVVFVVRRQPFPAVALVVGQRFEHQRMIGVQFGRDQFLALAVDGWALGQDAFPDELHHLRFDVLGWQQRPVDEAPEGPAHVTLRRHEA